MFIWDDIFGGSALTAFEAEAIKEMPAIVASVYNEIKNILKPAPTSAAEVGVAAVAKKQVTSLDANVLSVLKTINGKAVAEYVTANPKADLNEPTAQTAIAGLVDAGVAAYAQKQGLDLSGMKNALKSQILYSALIVYQAGMGLQAINVLS